MKKNIYLSIILISLFIVGCQQPVEQEESMDVVNQEEVVADAVDVFVQGIVDADQSVLEEITADELLYGHSSGRVEVQGR